MNIQNTILGLLIDGPQTGYELKQFFDSSLAFFSGASFGSIYPTLRRSAQSGLVRMEVEIQDGRPNRKIYSITDKGREIFLQGIREALTISPYRNEFLTRFFFYAHLDADKQQELIANYQAYLEKRQGQIRALADFAREKADAYQNMCFRFGIRYLDAMIANVRELHNELESYHNSKDTRLNNG